MVSGGFISFAVIKHGADRFRKESINAEGVDFRVGRWYDVIITWIVPVQVIVLIVWWFSLAIMDYDTQGWWNPFHTYSVGTCLVQWGVMIALFMVFNRWMVERTFRTRKD